MRREELLQRHADKLDQVRTRIMEYRHEGSTYKKLAKQAGVSRWRIIAFAFGFRDLNEKERLRISLALSLEMKK